MARKSARLIKAKIEKVKTLFVNSRKPGVFVPFATVTDKQRKKDLKYWREIEKVSMLGFEAQLAWWRTQDAKK